MHGVEGPQDGAVDLEADPERAAALCISAQARPLAAVALFTDADVRRSSRLPGWSVGHLLAHSQQRLEQLFTECSAAGWPGRQLMGGSPHPATGCPAHRFREVEVHHVDLGIGYEPADWPTEHLAWELPGLLASVPDRLRSREDQAALLAWLAGRAGFPVGLTLDPW